MINSEYLEDIMTRADLSGSIHQETGYDATMAIVENARATFPMLIIEDATSGTLSCDYGGVNTQSQSLWVMCAINERDGITRTMASQNAMTIIRKIVAILLVDKDIMLPEAAGLDIAELPYFARNTTVAAGWEIQLTFNESEDLTIADYGY